MKNTRDPSAHLSSLNKVTNPLADEANKIVKIIICLLLILSTFTVYWQVQDHEFIGFDDNIIITDNLNVQAGLTKESINWALTTFHEGNWGPLTWLSHILDYQFYGLNPKGHHLTNLFLHIVSALILFMVLLRMTGALWQCSFVAAMFALHPINVESVAWAAERTNTLSTLFWLITIWAYIHYAEKPTVKRYGLVFLFFTFGLMSKPMLVTLPFALLLLDYWPLGRLKFGQIKDSSGNTKNRKAIKSGILYLIYEKIPLFFLSAGSSIVTFIAVKNYSHLPPLEDISLSTRLTNAMTSYLKYLQKTLWPNDLAIFYPHPGNALVLWKGMLCGMALIGITVFAIRLFRKTPYFAVGWFWYLGTLVPVIGIVQGGEQAMADRYAYVPLIGIFIIVAWGLPELMEKWGSRGKILATLAAVCIPTLMLMTWVQVGHWKNTIAIFKHATRVTDSNALAHNNLGMALLDARKFEESIPHFKTAINIIPSFLDAHYNLGNAFLSTGKTKEAISHYKSAITLKPDDVDAHYNLGNAFLSAGRTKEAIFHYKSAITLKPDDAAAHHNLGSALVQKGNIREAINHYKKTLRLIPDHDSAGKNLKMALFRLEEYNHK
jgi:protein O-mannosyl-transferase